ncbi:unnamed protein product, partial [Staurois parvus]
MGRFRPVVCVSAPPTMGRFPPSSLLCLCPSHNGEIPPPLVVCVSAPHTMGRFPPVVCVSAPPTMGRFSSSKLCLCPSHNVYI